MPVNKKIQLRKRVVNKLYHILNNIYIKIEKQLLYDKVRRNKFKKNIYLFSNPIHSNLGDQAQTYCILEWFNEYYPDYNIISAPQRTTPQKTLNLIYKNLSKTDLIFIHSGYLIFDPHPNLPYICEVVNLFQDRQIVILPQTVNLVNDSVISEVANTFNKHSNLVLLCRDDISYSNAEALFPKCKLILFPDFVTSFIGFRNYHNKRNGILFCLRNDLEKLYTDIELNDLKLRFKNVKNFTTDTTILKSAFAWKYCRSKLVNSVIDDFSKYQLIITDRYHGTIFSQIASTPVIVLSSSDHKLSSGVKWFPELYFRENVFFAPNLDAAYKLAENILLRKGKIYENTTYFKDEYFSNLKKLLSEI